MLAIIFLTLSVLWVALAIWIIWLSVKENAEVEPIMAALAIMFIVCLLNGAALLGHISDIALIRNAETLYSVREKAIDRISDELASLPGQTALMNADSPAKTLIETKSEYVTALTDLQMEVAQAQVSIERRKMGPSAWVVWAIGDK